MGVDLPDNLFFIYIFFLGGGGGYLPISECLKGKKKQCWELNPISIITLFILVGFLCIKLAHLW
jgi:hypothetical protein